MNKQKPVRPSIPSYVVSAFFVSEGEGPNLLMVFPYETAREADECYHELQHDRGVIGLMYHRDAGDKCRSLAEPIRRNQGGLWVPWGKYDHLL